MSARSAAERQRNYRNRNKLARRGSFDHEPFLLAISAGSLVLHVYQGDETQTPCGLAVADMLTNPPVDFRFCINCFGAAAVVSGIASNLVAQIIKEAS